VSPITTIRRTSRFGTGKRTPSTTARFAPVGSIASHTVTGNADGFEFSGSDAVGRNGTVPAAKRTVIGTSWRSTRSTGQIAAAVTTRAIAPPSPITT